MAHDDAGTSPVGEVRRPVVQDPRREAAPTESAESATTPAAPVPSILGAVAAGIAAAVFGTALHGQLIHVGGTALPVGAVAALLLAGSLFLLSGLWSRNIIMTAVAGAVAYGLVGLLSASSTVLILTGSSEVAPGTAQAGNLWLFGVLVVTLAAVVIGAIVLGVAKRPRTFP